ncbi:MAG: long-chain fatty aldehyde decarbonylase [Cyanobacteriota bacterium]|jgi:hypothetical protein
MSPAYREAYSRINSMVIVGEGLADLNFRRLALLLPAERNELLRLAAMEARHARDFLLCGRNLGIRAVTASVLQDEAEHLDFGERWLGDRFPACAAAVDACCQAGGARGSGHAAGPAIPGGNRF